MTEKQIEFHNRNKYRKRIGRCVICSGESHWNEEKGRYDRFCSDACKAKYVEVRNKRMLDKYGTTNLAGDMDFQKNKLLANRSIAKVYEFQDGQRRIVLSNIEYGILSELEKMGYASDDIDAPASFVINYEFEGQKKQHIPDIFIKSLNLIISAKDGLDNPNTHPSFQKDRKKNICIYKSILDNYKYNYIQIEGEKEVKATKSIMETAEKVIRKNTRLIIPPRIDFVLYREGKDYAQALENLMERKYPDIVNADRCINKIHHALLELRPSGEYVGLYFSYDIVGEKIFIPYSEDDIDCLLSTEVSKVEDRNNVLVLIELSHRNITATDLFACGEKSNLLKLFKLCGLEYETGKTIDQLLEELFENNPCEEYQEFKDKIANIDEGVFEIEHNEETWE